MSAATSDLSRLGELARGLGLRQHRCLIYDTQEEQFAAALPYLIASFERGEKSLYVADENTAATVLDALRRAGTDVDRYLESGALAISGKQQTCLRHGRFDPDRWIGFMSEATREVSGRKLSGLQTILGEMTWVLGEGATPETLVEYEAKLNQFVRDHDVRVLCQYNRHRFSPELVLSVIRTHPVVAYGGIISKNPSYIPPDELLALNQPSREIERLLNNILQWQDSLDQLRALAARLLTVQENERKHLARELHDEIGQVLTGLRLLLNLNEDSPGDALKSRFEQARIIVEDLLDRVQGLSFDLRPADLDHLGLVPALLALFERYTAQTGILVNFKRRGIEGRFAPRVETGAYRIVQEALTNVARHARATVVTVRFQADPEMLSLQIEDRGRGFNSDLPLKGYGSSGLIGMQERATLLGGHLKVESVRGAGSTITAELPLEDTTGQ